MPFKSDAHRKAMFASRYGKLTKLEKANNDYSIENDIKELPMDNEKLKKELRFHQANQKYQDDIYHSKAPHYKNAERISYDQTQRMIDHIKKRVK